MAEITHEVAEYATVERLALMLRDVNEPYKTTETYALFTAILCWVLQRMRTPQNEGSLHARLARQVAGILDERRILGSPPRITSMDVRANGEVEEGPLGFATAKDVLIAFRDAVAHGDARGVKPVNENGYLTGHEFRLRCADETHHVRLSRREMAALGCDIADAFCDQMRLASNNSAIEDHAHAVPEDDEDTG